MTWVVRAPDRDLERAEKKTFSRVRRILWDYEPLEHFTKKIHEVDPEATGKPFGTVEGLKAMKDGLLRAGLYAFDLLELNGDDLRPLPFVKRKASN